MKNTLTIIRGWITRNKHAIIDTIITVISTLLMCAAIIAATIMGMVTVGGAWMGAGGDPETEAYLIVFAIAIIGFIALLAVIFKTEARYLRRRAETVGHAEGEPLGVTMLGVDHDDETLAMVALHEARHAIVADALGYTVTAISTIKTNASDGRIRWEQTDERSATDRRWSEILISLAPLGTNNGAPQTDDAQVYSQLMQILISGERPSGYSGELTLNNLLTEAIAQTRELVEFHQPAIDKLIDVLIERRVLHHVEISELFLSLRTLPTGTLTAPCYQERSSVQQDEVAQR